MLPTSVRRVMAAAPAVPVTAAASAPVVFRGHQRRFSSSKPSRSNDGSSGSSNDVPLAAAGRQQAKGSEKRRGRKAKEESPSPKLPSVPSTQHMAGEPVGLSSFFSLHRPMSITQTIPRPVSDEAFASIFSQASKAKGLRTAETISALTNTIDQIEGPMASMTLGGQHDQPDDAHRPDVRNADGSESSIYLQVDAMSGEFLPFRPPPIPRPQPAHEAEAETAAAADVAEAEPQSRVYRAMFTIEENTDPSGQIRIVAHSPEIVRDRQPRSFLERLAQRQLRFDEAQGMRERDVHAISVKRQRKLKMKKKKYKKLMRRTRNLRRKLDRT